MPAEDAENSFPIADRVAFRIQLGLILSGYAIIFSAIAFLAYQRYQLELLHPDDFNGGMAAFGDLIQGLFFLALLSVPTLFLIRLLAKSERNYTGYTKVLFWVSLTSPLALVIGSTPLQKVAGDVCLSRLIAAPVLLVLYAFSRWMGQFEFARRLMTRAMLIEGLTFVATIVVLFAESRH
jgi:hypothetical protein